MNTTSFSLELFKATLDGLSETFVLLSPKHKVLACNHILTSVIKLVFHHEIQMGDDHRKFVFEHDEILYNKCFEKALLGETAVYQSFAEINGHFIELEYRLCPVYADAGELIGVALYAKNLSIQEKASHALENIKSTFETILNNIPDSVCLLNEHYQLLQFNEQFQKAVLANTGRSASVGNKIQECIFIPEQEQFLSYINQAVSGVSSEIELQATTCFGKEICLSMKLFPVYDKLEVLLGICLIVVDITQKKLTEESAHENELKFKKIIDTAPIPIIIVDRAMNIILTNPETARFFRYDEEELLNQNINILIPESLRKNHADLQEVYLENPKLYRMGMNRYTPAQTKEGDLKMVEVSLNSFQLKGELFVLAIIQDVTQRIEHEKQLKKQVEVLEEIAWQHAHEIRRPLANIIGLLNALKTEYEHLVNHQNMGYLCQSATELDEIIYRIIKISRERKNQL